MVAKVTQPPELPDNSTGIPSYLKAFSAWVVRELGYRSPDTATKDSILLASPDGSVYSVRVSDAGALTATKVKSA